MNEEARRFFTFILILNSHRTVEEGREVLARRLVGGIAAVLCALPVVKHAYDPKSDPPRRSVSQPSQSIANVREPALTPEQQNISRKLYAMIEAGDENCPELTKRWAIQTGVRYDLSPPGEIEKLEAAKQEWFDQFKKVGRRLACSGLADEFGPGNDPHLFDLD